MNGFPSIYETWTENKSHKKSECDQKNQIFLKIMAFTPANSFSSHWESLTAVKLTIIFEKSEVS